MKIRNKRSTFIFVACLLAISLLVMFAGESEPSVTQGAKAGSGQETCPHFYLPESVLSNGFELAGERVPITRPDVKARIEFQINFLLLDARSALAEWLNEKRRYFWILEEILTKEGIPKDFSWLSPVLVSVNRLSSGRLSPVGIWSLDKPCASGEGVEMYDDDWRDDRLDIHLATRCFASRVKAIKSEVGDGWLMASVAYVMSVQATRDLIQKWESANVWDIPLPDHIEDMISRWAAFKIIGTHRSSFGLKLSDPPPLTYDNLVSIELTKDLSVADISKMIDVPSKSILELNPKIKIGSGIFPAKKNGKMLIHSIAVPSGSGKNLLDKLVEAGYVTGSRK